MKIIKEFNDIGRQYGGRTSEKVIDHVVAVPFHYSIPIYLQVHLQQL